MNQHVGEHSDSISDDIIGVGGMVILDLCPVEGPIPESYTAMIDKSGFLSYLNRETDAGEY